MSMTIREMLERQFSQQQRIIGPRPEGRAEQRELASRFTHYLIREVYEYLDAMSFKHFLPLDEAPRATRIMELVDIHKFNMTLMWLEGVTAAEFESLFLSKTELVEERLREKHLASRIAGFDIDGVLAQWAFQPEESEEVKQDFYESGGALLLQPFAGARETLESLKAEGWGIVLVTARKIGRHSRLEHETYEWLRKHDIPFDVVLFGYDKEEALSKSGVKLSFFVEDHPKHAIDIAKTGTDVLLLRSKEASHEHIHYIDDIVDVIAWLRDRHVSVC